MFKIISLNSKGFNIPEKRTKLLVYMKKLKSDIILLQETNFHSNNIPKLANKEFPTVFHATNNLAKTKGVTILLPKNLPLEIMDSLVDDEGRYLFIKGVLWGKPINIANIYSPNKAHYLF